MISQDLKNTILEFQRKEITEHEIYRKLAEKTGGKNAEVLKRISDDELRHYNVWKKYTQKEIDLDRLSVLKYLIISTIFGLTFVMKIMEGGKRRPKKPIVESLANCPRPNSGS